MFEQTFVPDSESTKTPFTLAFSVLLQASAICILVLIPLIYTEALPTAVFKDLLVAPLPPRAPVQEPPQSKALPKVVTRSLQLHQLYAPVSIPKKIVMMDQLSSAPDIGIAAAASDSNNALGLGLTGVIGSVPGPPPPPVLPAPKKKSPEGPVRVSRTLEEANLVHRVMPIYPPLAKSARVQGTVEFTALISKEGNIENLRLVRGHPLLVEAAREAIEQWKYRPTILNGVPVEVVTDIIVNFTLNN